MRNLLLSMSLAALIACDRADPNGDPPIGFDAASLARFEDCSDLRSYVADAWLETLIQSRYGGWRYWAEDGASTTATSGPSDFSTTNVQEAGVDEPDIVKTDGNFVYVVQQSNPELTIVQSWPIEETSVAGRVALDGWPYNMFLAGDRVAVFSWVYDGYEGVSDSLLRDGYGTRITLVDVSDRAHPQIERTIDVDGYMSDARMIDTDMYLVTNAVAYVPNELWEVTNEASLDLPEYDWEATEAEQEAMRAAARQILRPLVEDVVGGTPIASLIPRQYETLPGEAPVAADLLACADIYHPEGVSAPAVLSVAHLDLAEESGLLTATGLMASGWTVYASQDNLYVAQSSWWWWWGWGDLDLSTHVHRFALDGAETRYEASGVVQGWLWDQFAMSEYEGYLRVATTDFDWWWGVGNDEGDNGNNVLVLDQDLHQVGAVTGFAPGEQIYASRFLGDEGYVVTYRQVDPLFTFDLSDPTNPQLKGELTMPGFSSYLHPYGDGRLIGVGMDGDENGNVFGLAINLFDVSDLAAPARIDQVLVESDDWSWSEALWDHHAFTLHRDVLSLPLYTWNWEESTGDWNGFSGILSVAVSDDALAEVGRVSHSDLVDASECLYAWWDEYGTCYDDYWYAYLRRSVVIEDNLFSISDYGLKVTDLNDPTIEHARVLFWPKP